MRSELPEILRRGRVRRGPMASPDSFGFQGAFQVLCASTGRYLNIVASTGEDWAESGLGGVPWEHVSVSLARRPHFTPAWIEMCFIKDLFWEAEEAVLQFHPRASRYINHRPGTLHLWRPVGVELPEPPTITIGFVRKSEGGFVSASTTVREEAP